MFAANRWEKHKSILEILNQGSHVILDRYAYSGVVYSASKGLDLEWCKHQDIGLPKPDIVLYLDASEELCSQRTEYGQEIFEKIEFQKKVKSNYMKLREDRWIIIDANQEISNVQADI